MKTSLLSLFAGTMFLAGAAGASAGEPVTLASAELDTISAGFTIGDVTDAFDIARIRQDLDQSNDSDVHVVQYGGAVAYAYWGNATATLIQNSEVKVEQKNVSVNRITQ